MSVNNAAVEESL